MTRRAYLPRLDTIIVLYHAAATAVAVPALGELAAVILDAVLVIIVLNCGFYGFLGEHGAVQLMRRESVKRIDDLLVADRKRLVNGFTLISSVAMEDDAMALAQPKVSNLTSLIFPSFILR